MDEHQEKPKTDIVLEVGHRVRGRARGTNPTGPRAFPPFGTIIEKKMALDIGMNRRYWAKVVWHPEQRTETFLASELLRVTDFGIDVKDETSLVRILRGEGYRLVDREIAKLQKLGLVTSIVSTARGRALSLSPAARDLAEMLRSERAVLRQLNSGARPAPTRDGIRAHLQMLLQELKGDEALGLTYAIEAIERILDGSFKSKQASKEELDE